LCWEEVKVWADSEPRRRLIRECESSDFLAAEHLSCAAFGMAEDPLELFASLGMYQDATLRSSIDDFKFAHHLGFLLGAIWSMGKVRHLAELSLPQSSQT